jgi:hypothetical protein
LDPSGSAAGHVVQGVSAATNALSGDVTVTLSGAAAFTSASSYTCAGHDSTNTDGAGVVSYASGTSVVFSLVGTDRGDTVTFFCAGS